MLQGVCLPPRVEWDSDLIHGYPFAFSTAMIKPEILKMKFA